MCFVTKHLFILQNVSIFKRKQLFSLASKPGWDLNSHKQEGNKLNIILSLQCTRKHDEHLWVIVLICQGFPGGSVVKSLLANIGDTPLIPGSTIFPEGGNGNPLQYSCLESPMDGGPWRATVHGVTNSQTRLSNWACIHLCYLEGISITCLWFSQLGHEICN